MRQDDEAEDTGTQTKKGKSVQKRSEPPTNMGNQRRKARRISAGQGITTMASSMDTAFDSLKDMFVGATQSAPRSESLEIQTQAMEAIERDEGLSKEDFLDAVTAMTSNISAANAYLHIKDKALRTSYLLRQMEKFKKYD
jgi:GTP cyclohydrolase III